MDQGLRVGLITNDQGSDLVDTALLRACGLATQEVPGGCFCCRFDALLDASQQLLSETSPDVLIAEAVGSCTDLAATVTYPLRRLLGDRHTVGPLSVLVDPIRVRQVLGREGGATFSDNVRYIYLKQLEEADVIVIGKRDLLADDEVASLRVALSTTFPQAEVLAVSARRGDGLHAWFHRIVFAEQRPRRTIDVDYGRYAEGEAKLGWLNAVISVSASAPVEGDRLVAAFAGMLQLQLAAVPAEVAHLKLVLYPADDVDGGVAAVNVVRNDIVPELGRALGRDVSVARLLVNLRAEAPPDVLDACLTDALRLASLTIPASFELEHRESFSPAPPRPTHRDASVV